MTPIPALLVGLLITTSAFATNLDVVLREFGVTPAERRPAPAFSLKTVDGARTTLAAERGRAVLLYFWGTW